MHLLQNGMSLGLVLLELFMWMLQSDAVMSADIKTVCFLYIPHEDYFGGFFTSNNMDNFA